MNVKMFAELAQHGSMEQVEGFDKAELPRPEG